MHTIKYRKILELSHKINENIVSWPGDEKLGHPYSKKLVTNYKNNGFYSNSLTILEHAGTHMDAPIHGCENRLSIDQISIDSFIVNGCVIDTSEQVETNPDYHLQVGDIINWEKINGKIRGNSFVIMKTDWSKYWDKPLMYINKDHSGIMHFPGFSKESIEFLIKERGIVGIGVETLSIDPGNSDKFEVHKILFSSNKYAIENMTNIKFLPVKNFTIIAIPLRINTGSGSPVTVIALI